MRSWSNIHVATRIILLVVLIVGLLYIYIPIYYQLRKSTYTCPASQGAFIYFNGIWNFIIFSLGPLIVMLIFGSLTIRHVQQSLQRCAPQEATNPSPNSIIITTTIKKTNQRRRKAIDRQLIRMMIIQCVYFSVLSTPISVQYIYYAVNITVEVDALQRAKDDLFGNITGYLSFTSTCTSFYLFTLSSQLFRRHLMDLFTTQCRWIRETIADPRRLTRIHR